MMDPGKSPTSSDLADFPRKVRDSRAEKEEVLAGRQTNDRERIRYRELFDHAPDAYLVTDVNGTIRDANRAAGRLLGVESRFLPGKSIQAFFEEAGQNQYRQQLDRLCHSDRVDDWDVWLTSRNRPRTPVAISLSRATSRAESGTTYRWMLRDSTRQKKTEDSLRQEAEAATRMKSDFLALLSHEFRTPLQAIFGYTELLEREIHGPLNESQRRDLQRIRQSQEHLLGLITTILDFARMESGVGIDVEMAPVVVNDILSNIEGFLSPQLESKGLSYSYNCPDESLVVRTDAVKLESIVLNLVANAIKFTPVGGKVAVECFDGGEIVRVRVRDNGIGIPADKLDAIFEPFVQLRAKGTTTSGSGLGLPISRRLAAAIGAELTVCSVDGSGSTFTLSLPSISQ
ncbi:MAG TPA: PAS domain-containing sensor histidine kinase [Gemmatimonadaceae bacterium]